MNINDVLFYFSDIKNPYSLNYMASTMLEDWLWFNVVNYRVSIENKVPSGVVMYMCALCVQNCISILGHSFRYHQGSKMVEN